MVDKLQNSSTPDEDINAEVSRIKEALRIYGETKGLNGLEGRSQRGLDPAGMLAIQETRSKAEQIAAALGADMTAAEARVIKMHTTGPWEAGKLIGEIDQHPDIKLWMILAQCCTGDHSGDMDEATFIRDTADVNARLDRAVADPDGFFREAYHDQVEMADSHFILEDGVPVTETDHFKSMRIKGYEAGVMKDGELLFVGSENPLDYEGIARSFGLEKVEKEDRGRMATFYVRKSGDESVADENVIKALYPGFGIILNNNIEMAKKLALTGMKEKAADIAEVRDKIKETV